MITQTITEDCYFLPDDGTAAKVRFLELLHDPGETYISAYGFTMAALVDEILTADSRGIAIHLLLDHTQACGRTEAPLVKELAARLQHGDVTITTAGLGSRSKSQIFHWKALAVEAQDGDPWCWEGSCNFSDSGWLQGNSARVFRSRGWFDAFVANFKAHREWARTYEPQYNCVPVQSSTAGRIGG